MSIDNIVKISDLTEKDFDCTNGLLNHNWTIVDNNDGNVTLQDGQGSTVATVPKSDLVDNGDGSFTFTNNDGTDVTFNVNSTVVQSTGNTDADLAFFLANTIATHTNGSGVVTTINETVSTLTDNADGTIDYSNELGGLSNIDICQIVSTHCAPASITVTDEDAAQLTNVSNLLLDRDLYIRGVGDIEGSIDNSISTSFADAVNLNEDLVSITTPKRVVIIGSQSVTNNGNWSLIVSARDVINDGEYTIASGRDNINGDSYTLISGRSNNFTSGFWNIHVGANNIGVGVRSSVTIGSGNDYSNGVQNGFWGGLQNIYSINSTINSVGVGKFNTRNGIDSSLLAGSSNSAIDANNIVQSGQNSVIDGQGGVLNTFVQVAVNSQVIGESGGGFQFGSTHTTEACLNTGIAGVNNSLLPGMNTNFLFGSNIQPQIVESDQTYVNFLHLYGNINTGPQEITSPIPDILVVDPSDEFEIKTQKLTAKPIINITSDYTVTEDDHTIIIGLGADNITLPPASLVTGQVFNLKETDITVFATVTSTDLIDGLGSHTFTVINENLSVQSNGTTYYII